MTDRLYWTTLGNISISYPDQKFVIEKLKKVFDCEFPIHLDYDSDYTTLEVMSMMCPNEENPFNELCKALSEHRTIIIGIEFDNS